MRDRLLAAEKVKAIDWRGEALYLLDQRSLPFEENWLAYSSAQGVAQAIGDMIVRGAPAIGIAAAYGVLPPQTIQSYLVHTLFPKNSWA